MFSTDDEGEEKRFRLVRNEDGTSDGDVDQWIKDLRERKEWFSDIWDATESEFKLNDEKKKQKPGMVQGVHVAWTNAGKQSDGYWGYQAHNMKT